MLFSGDSSGTTALSGGPCDGTTIDLADANERKHQLVTTRTDSDGALAFTPASMSRSDCSSGAIQGLDLTTCEVTEVVSLKIDCGTIDDGLIAYWSGNETTADYVGGHHGLTEGTVDYAPGVWGDAFDFDGRSAVKIPVTDDISFDDGEPFTWAMWIYYEGTSTPVAMYDGGAFSLYFDGELKSASGECSRDVLGSRAEFRIGSSGTCAGWVGLVDEVKLWDRALEADEILCVSNRPHH